MCVSDKSKHWVKQELEKKTTIFAAVGIAWLQPPAPTSLVSRYLNNLYHSHDTFLVFFLCRPPVGGKSIENIPMVEKKYFVFTCSLSMHAWRLLRTVFGTQLSAIIFLLLRIPKMLFFRKTFMPFFYIYITFPDANVNLYRITYCYIQFPIHFRRAFNKSFFFAKFTVLRELRLWFAQSKLTLHSHT